MASGPTFTIGATVGPTFTPAARGASFTVGRAAGPVFDDTIAEFTPAQGGGEMVTGGCVGPTSGAGTIYLGEVGESQTEAHVQIPVAAMTARRLFVRRNVAPGGGCACTYTLRRNGADTGLVVTLGAADTSGASTPGTTLAFNAGDRLSVAEVRSGSVAAGRAAFSVDAQYAS